MVNVTWRPLWPKLKYFCGLDLGQSRDPTAIAVIEERTEPLEPGTLQPNPETRTTLDVRHLERLPLRTSYPDVIAHVQQMLASAPLRGNARLIVDATGVGKPVVDLLRKANLRPVAITITAGADFSQDGRDFRVSKLVLVSQLQALFHSGELRIADALPEAATLKGELANFRANITESGAMTFGARSGRHDDLVLSLAIAAWYCKHAYRNRITSREFAV